MKKYSSTPYLVWSALFIILPIFIIIYYAFTSSDGSFTFDNFNQLSDPIVYKVIGRSFYLASLATLISLVLGYPVACILTKISVRYEQMLLMLIVLPMWMNFLLRTYAIQYLLGPTGFVNSILMRLGFKMVPLLFNQGAVLFGMVYNYCPFMILPIYTVISKMDSMLIEAAEDLGATKREIFKYVIIPVSLPGIISGITMTFMPAVSTFVISALLGGGKYDLIGNMIEREFTLLSNWNLGSMLSFVLLLAILILMLILNRFDDESTVI